MSHYNFRAKCIVCSVEWGSSDISEDDITGALCPECTRSNYTERIRDYQIRNGHSDCFARGYEDCEEFDCIHRYACLAALIAGWRGQVIHEGKIKT